MKLMKHVMGCLFVTAMATPAMAQSIEVDDVLVCASDDTHLVSGGDAILATSASESPMVTFDGQAERIWFEAAGVGGASSKVEPDSLTVEVDVARGDVVPMETLALNFTKITYVHGSSSSSKFDGRFLTARDLTRDQSYVLDIEGGGFEAYRADFFSGGIFVGSAAIGGVVKGFTLTSKGESVHAAGRTATGGEWIEIASTTFDVGGARLPDGRQISFDTMVVSGRESAEGTHEVGHYLSADVPYVAAIHSVAMTGVPAMWVEVE
jgi:hypothetical protein